MRTRRRCSSLVCIRSGRQWLILHANATKICICGSIVFLQSKGGIFAIAWLSLCRLVMSRAGSPIMCFVQLGFSSFVIGMCISCMIRSQGSPISRMTCSKFLTSCANLPKNKPSTPSFNFSKIPGPALPPYNILTDPFRP